MSNIRRFGPCTPDQIAAIAEEASRGGGGSFAKLQPGKNILRILPAEDGKPIITVHQHYVELPGMDGGVGVNCPQMMAKRPCIVCQYAAKLKASGNPSDYEIGDKLYPRKRHYAAVIMRKSEEAGPQVWAFSKSILDYLVEMFDSAGDWTDVENGYDICVTKSGSGLSTKYMVTAQRGTCPLSDDEDQANAWLDALPNLAQYARVETDQEIARKCGGTIPVPTRSATPVRASAPAARGKRRSVEDDMSEEGDE